MKDIYIEAQINTDNLPEILARQLSDEELVKFIREIDGEKMDCSFSEELFKLSLSIMITNINDFHEEYSGTKWEMLKSMATLLEE